MKPEYSEEFKFWYERFFLQSPSLCALEYDDEKMYEAWKAGYNMGLAKGTKLIEEDNKDDCV
jgi:hypothetical protein